MPLNHKLRQLLLILIYLARHPRRFYNALSARGKTWAMRSLILLIIIGIAVPTSLWYSAKHAKAAWWNDNWAYRIAISVTNNAAEEANVYISLEDANVVNTSDTAKFQADCGDIRFTNLHGVQLSHYIVSGCGTAATVIHVNFEIFPAGAQTIYMYYGNPSAPNGFASADFSTPASSYIVGSLGSEEIGPGPAAYWKFDEGQGDTAYDSTSNNNDGNLGDSPANPTWKPEADCVAGKCLSFDGSDDVVTVASAVNNIQSVGFWAKINSATTTEQLIDLNGTDYIQSVSGVVTANSFGTETVYVDGMIGTAITANEWHYIAVTTTGGLTGNAIKIGQVSTNYGQVYIDEAKIYPYARNEDQIKQDYNAGTAGSSTSTGSAAAVGESPKWMTDGLVGHWKMDESSNTVVADSSGNGNTGTLTGAQETGTAEAASTTALVYDADNASLSATNDAYNNMILRFSPVCGSIPDGTERTITDYDGAGKFFTVAALPAEADSCAFEIRHQTGGKFGNGLGFDKTNDKVALPDNTENSPLNFTSQDFTISGWIKPESIPTAMRIFIRGGYNSRGYILTMYNGQLGLGTYQTSALQETWASAGTVTSGSWQHVTAVRKGSKVWLYKNGSETTYGSRANHLDPLSTNTAGSIGLESTSTWPFHGQMDDLRIYNRALSPDEVKALSEYGPGPVGHWKMDENVSGNGQTIYDQSGNGLNGTTDDGANNTGMDCTKQGKYGGGCNLDGVDDYVNLGNSSTLNPKQISVSTWIKEGELPESYAGVVARGWAGSYMMDEQIDGSIRWRIGTMGSSCVTNTGAISNRNEWHHVEGTYDGITAKVYLDGALKSTCGLTDYLVTSTSNTRIGNADSTYNFPGLIDDVRVYNYARSAKQITEDMNAGHPIGGSPVGSAQVHLKFDEGQGATAQDSSINNRDGTMTPQSGGQTQTYQLWDNGGKFNRAADLDGTDDYISIPDFSY